MECGPEVTEQTKEEGALGALLSSEVSGRETGVGTGWASGTQARPGQGGGPGRSRNMVLGAGCLPSYFCSDASFLKRHYIRRTSCRAMGEGVPGQRGMPPPPIWGLRKTPLVAVRRGARAGGSGRGEWPRVRATPGQPRPGLGAMRGGAVLASRTSAPWSLWSQEGLRTLPGPPTHRDASTWHSRASFVSRRKNVWFGQVWPPRRPGLALSGHRPVVPIPGGNMENSPFPRMCKVPRPVAPRRGGGGVPGAGEPERSRGDEQSRARLAGAAEGDLSGSVARPPPLRRLGATRLLPPGESRALSFHINKTFNRFLANWQENCM